MKKNLGAIDKIVRLVVAALLVVAYFQGLITGILGIVLIILAVVFAATSLISFCPIYHVFGISSKPVEKKQD